MSRYPKARWSVGAETLGVSVWTRKVPEGGGGGYYLYTWERTTDRITLEELVEGATRTERRAGTRSAYVTLAVLPVPREALRLKGDEREVAVARLIHADLRERFGEIAEWIPYGGDGKPIWFHPAVTGRG